MYRVGDDRTQWFLNHILPHEPVLRAWLGRRKSGVEIDDIIQESYTVLAARETVADIQHPKAYLFQIAHSIVVRHVRRSRVVPIQAVDDLEVFAVPDDIATPEQTVIGRDELRHIGDAIAAMSGRVREAFILRRVHGLSQREIASRMWLSERTVEKHIAQGVRFLTGWAAHRAHTVSQSLEDNVAEEYGTSSNEQDEYKRNQSRH